MPIKVVVKRNRYFDSVSLMSISTRANRIEGVKQAVVAMATEMNKGVLRNVGLFTPEVADAHGGDLLIVIESAQQNQCEAAAVEIAGWLDKREPPSARVGAAEAAYATLDGALRVAPQARLAIVSVPGEYAAREARRAIDHGLHVMLFSDNVAIDDEIAIKEAAHLKGLLVMGPDCGTAILGGIGLCFANKVRRGAIGIVAASGTGSQEVGVRIHGLGGGVSQLIGTGGRDLSEAVGGIMMIDALRALDGDPGTRVIVLISKPPAKAVALKILGEVKACTKPVVVCFLGGTEADVIRAGGHFAHTTSEAAAKAVALAAGRMADGDGVDQPDAAWLAARRALLRDGQRHVRALMCGGTLCDELMMLVAERHPNVFSNTAKSVERRLADAHTSRDHSFIDFGDDEFTRGRPHPMIDPTLRIERLQQEAQDPSVAVIVLDFIVGFGSHEDPVGVTMPAIRIAQETAARNARHLEIVGYVLGTAEDRPSLTDQVRQLQAAGVTVATSCTQAGLIARALVDTGART